jgi:hypothetical protein
MKKEKKEPVDKEKVDDVGGILDIDGAISSSEEED